MPTCESARDALIHHPRGDAASHELERYGSIGRRFDDIEYRFPRGTAPELARRRIRTSTTACRRSPPACAGAERRGGRRRSARSPAPIFSSLPLEHRMLDARYFRDQLREDVAAMGELPVVEVRLRTGQVHRVKSVRTIENGYVTLDRYKVRGDVPGWGSKPDEQVFDAGAAGEVELAVVPYESILDVVVTSERRATSARIGFAGAGDGTA